MDREHHIQRARKLYERIDTLQRPQFAWKRAVRGLAALLVGVGGGGGLSIYLLERGLVQGTAWYVKVEEGKLVIMAIASLMILCTFMAIVFFLSKCLHHAMALHQYREQRAQLQRDAARVAIYLRKDEHVVGALSEALEHPEEDEAKRGAISPHRIEW